MDKKYKRSFEESDKAYENDNSAIENNKNDLVSEQGDSGIMNIDMVPDMSKIEKEYQIRSERDYRDEENPMYDDADETWGAPDNF